jgi:AcrR family transcriptional regulator
MTPAPVALSARSDARRNRAKLIETAAMAFRDEGLDVTVDEIARRAGVGVATLYRHFPAKEDLVVAVMMLVHAEFEEAALAAIAGGEPEGVVERFLVAVQELQDRNRGFLETLARSTSADGLDELQRRTVASLERIVTVARQAGALPPDFGALDLLTVVRMLAVTSKSPRRERYLALLLSGLRTLDQ